MDGTLIPNPSINLYQVPCARDPTWWEICIFVALGFNGLKDNEGKNFHQIFCPKYANLHEAFSPPL